MTMKSIKRSAIALAILAMLYEAPMHPYRMQRLIKERGKDLVINVEQRASLYQTIQRLEREGLITALQTLRDEGRPERTVYEIAEKGRTTLVTWMHQILSKPTMEYPDFPAAISFLPLLSPEDARRHLELRAVAIETQIQQLDEGLREAAKTVPRLFLLESELMRAAQATELAWVKSIIEDLRTGRITWSEAWLREIAAKFESDSSGGTE
jgi:DNA-binding PadR family transcriptional regulator